MRSSSWPGVLAVAAVFTAFALPCRADDEADGKDLFARGRDLRAKGDCAGAVDLFRKSSQLYPRGLGSLRNLAECEEALGHFASSRRAWLDLKRGLVTVNEAKYEGWEKDAETSAARLAPKVGTLLIHVIVQAQDGESEANAQSPIALSLNAEKLPLDLVGTPIERDPGQYIVHVEAKQSGPEPHMAERKIDLGPGQSQTITLRVAVPAPPVAAPPGDTGNGVVTPAHAPSNAKRTAGFIALGTGGALLAGALVSFIVRQSAISDLRTACPNYASAPCDPSVQSTVSRGQLASTLVNVLGATGLVFAVGGSLLVIASPAPAPAAVAVWRF